MRTRFELIFAHLFSQFSRIFWIFQFFSRRQSASVFVCVQEFKIQEKNTNESLWLLLSREAAAHRS